MSDATLTPPSPPPREPESEEARLLHRVADTWLALATCDADMGRAAFTDDEAGPSQFQRDLLADDADNAVCDVIAWCNEHPRGAASLPPSAGTPEPKVLDALRYLYQRRVSDTWAWATVCDAFGLDGLPPGSGGIAAPPSAGPTREQVEALIAAGSDPLPWVPTHLTADSAPPSAVGIEPDHPEARCKDCGGPNIIWFAPNDVWNRVMPDESGVLCPVCFVRRAAAAGLDHVWKLAPEASPAPPPAGSGETELVEAARDLIAYALDMGADYTVRAVDFERLQSALAAHPAGTTREEEIVEAFGTIEHHALSVHCNYVGGDEAITVTDHGVDGLDNIPYHGSSLLNAVRKFWRANPHTRRPHPEPEDGSR